MTRTHPAGCEGRGAFRATVQNPTPPVLGRRHGLSPCVSGAAHPGRSKQDMCCDQRLLSRLTHAGPQQPSGVAAGAPRCEAEAPRSLWSQLDWLVQAWESNPRHTVYQTVALTTELTCLRARPRPRAVHACAIHSAGAPGGTHEPAPLTRLPSRSSDDANKRTRRILEHEAGVEPACFGFKAQRGCRQPTARV